MQFDEVIQARRSVRGFRPDAVPDSGIRALIDAARLAPSGLNAQPWRFVVVKGAEARARVAAATPSQFVGEAPAVIVCCADREAYAAAGGPYAALLTEEAVSEQLTIGLSAAVTHLLLKAADLGLGACWVGLFDEETVKAAVGLGGRYAVKALVPVGYPAGRQEPVPRLPAEELVLKTID